MPDANTIWTFVFAMVTLSLTGLAYWAYRHPQTYWKPLLTIFVVCVLIDIPALTSLVLLWAIAADIGTKLTPQDTKIVSTVLSSYVPPPIIGYLMILIQGATLALSYVAKNIKGE